MEALTGLASRLYEARSVVLVVVVLYLSYQTCQWIYRAYSFRNRYGDIPSPPRHPIWGNIVNAGPRLSPALNRHPDYGFEEIWHELGEPSCFLLDLYPIDGGFLIIAEPQHAEMVVNQSEHFKYSVPKSDTYSALKPLIGPESMISKEGADWKTMRKRFNAGFQPKYIHSLSGSVVSRTEIFVQRLQAAAKAGITFKLAEYAKDLTTDIITQMTIAQDAHAQTTPEGQGEKSATGLLTASRRLSALCYRVGLGPGLHMIDPIRPLKALYYSYVYNSKVTAIVSARIKSTDATSKAKSITELAVSGLTPSKTLIRSSVDQIKSFLFAGQDTTATLIQWLCYEISKASHSPHHAAILTRLRQEHDTVFGSSFFSAMSYLSSQSSAEKDSIFTSKLPYTTAFIKETLRLHPPAGTARLVPAEAPNFELNIPHSVSIAGLRIYPCQYLIHRNPKIWGPDAHVFNPDRWLDEAYVAALPAGAYRPFERGPRNCIGQELAMLEGKVVLACVARGLVFEKVGLTGRVVVEGGEKEKEVWSIHAVTSIPVDGMVMRVSERISAAS